MIIKGVKRVFNILVVEDDKNLRRLMETVLKQNGYHPIIATDGQIAIDLFDKEHVDLVITDIMMPNMDGYELARMLRLTNPLIPILMVTAKDTYEDKKKGFMTGVDDYMVKPVDMSEMLLHVTALLRRAQIMSEHKIKIGDITLDYRALSITYRAEIITLPPKEFYLIQTNVISQHHIH